ncbi:hypothetical protein T265_09607 [Opisthorchis viverrini]|uniref:Uncharacterized protein n=1 Tax=Opisthorchis viverrini TaxID=6198 RepID=A0A074Z585_OPIVI|nr:hypothetical protein T265_09607 [Opisthorchis viverrini]KER22281.1 hypothetical protein T265_09607 [Opisthorchis viverrini]
MSTKAEKRYTDAQLQARLSKLAPDQQHCFFRYADPLLNEESDMYLSVISKCRMSFADAIAKLKQTEPTDEDEVDEEESTEVANSATPFDTSTQIGKHMALIGLAFSEILEAQKERARSADLIQRKKQLKLLAGEETEEPEDGKRGKKKKRPKKSRKKHGDEDEEKYVSKSTLADELKEAAEEEQKLLMEKMMTHGSKMKEEQERQKEKTAEKLNEARSKKHGQAEAVDYLFDKKQELDELQQQDKSRQEQAVKERLEKRKQNRHRERNPSSTDLGDVEEAIEGSQSADPIQTQEKIDETNGSEAKEQKTRRKKRQKQAEETGEIMDTNIDWSACAFVAKNTRKNAVNRLVRYKVSTAGEFFFSEQTTNNFQT